MNGISEHVHVDVEEARVQASKPLEVIEGTLMEKNEYCWGPFWFW